MGIFGFIEERSVRNILDGCDEIPVFIPMMVSAGSPDIFFSRFSELVSAFPSIALPREQDLDTYPAALTRSIELMGVSLQSSTAHRLMQESIKAEQYNQALALIAKYLTFWVKLVEIKNTDRLKTITRIRAVNQLRLFEATLAQIIRATQA
ncbi:hypothetical protein [Methylobacterium ajmalii]|uniref:hypothetical protein n=1 Tax=Methylobacterium ajmalii TaxID=2738439 RepID=UPI002F357A99